jgi:hypothetical protein
MYYEIRRAEACVCVFNTAVHKTKLFAWGEGDSEGHVLRETTSRDLCCPGLVCPSPCTVPVTVKFSTVMVSGYTVLISSGPSRW